MATTYKQFLTRAQGNPKSGQFYLYCKVDFSELPAALAATDEVQIGKVGDGWLLVDSRYRMPTASTSTSTFDIGTDTAGNNIADDVDADGALTGWTQGSATNAAAVEITADEFVIVTANGDISDGVLEVMLTICAVPGDDEPQGVSDQNP